MCPSDNSYFDCINLCFEKNKFKMLTPILSGILKQQNEEAMSLAVGRLNSIAGGGRGGGAMFKACFTATLFPSTEIWIPFT